MNVLKEPTGSDEYEINVIAIDLPETNGLCFV